MRAWPGGPSTAESAGSRSRRSGAEERRVARRADRPRTLRPGRIVNMAMPLAEKSLEWAYVPVGDGTRSRTSYERDGALRASDDAQSAGPAGIGIGRVRGSAAMRQNPKFGEWRQAAELAVVHPSNLEHVVGADDHTVALGFAAGVIDDWGPGSSWGIAVLARTIRMLGGPSFLGQCFRFFRVTHGLSSPLVGNPTADRRPGWCRSGNAAANVACSQAAERSLNGRRP